MIFILLLSAIFTVLHQSMIRTDCYVSFSYPPIHIKISHFYPNGPPYLYISFMYMRYSTFSNKTIWDLIFHSFKRVDYNCIPSVLFTTFGKDIQTLQLSIDLRLNKNENSFSSISYIFRKGFKPGVYEMFDKNQNFILHTNILYDNREYFRVYVSRDEDANSYLNSISGKSRELCIVTENNRAALLKPSYEYTIPYGYITRFRAKIYKFDKLIGVCDYPAFECNKSEIYPEESVVFITDGEEFNIKIYVINHLLIQIAFQLYNQKYNYVYNLKYIPKEYKQIFVMKHKTNVSECFDDHQHIVYLSEYNIPYYTRVFQRFRISSKVEYSGFLNQSSYDRCKK